MMRPAIHISLNVSNLEQAADFYTRFLGEPTKRKPGYVKFVGRAHDLHLALQEAPGKRPAGERLSHLGIRVESQEEVRRWKQTLTERGLFPSEAKQTACCYALQEKVWIADPDGNQWEIYTVLEDLVEESEIRSPEADARRMSEPCCPQKENSQGR